MACGDNNADDDDAIDAPAIDARIIDAAAIDAVDAPIIDAPIDAAIDAPIDAPIDAAIDAPIDGPPTSSELIGFARAASPGTGLTLPIMDATITYIKPVGGTPANDPAGFTIQAAPTGPALMVAVDPATLTPAPAVGDVVSFTITDLVTVGAQPRATAITGYTRTTPATDINPLVQNLTAAADVVSNLGGYDSEVIDISGTIAMAFATAGNGFQAAQVTTTGIPAASVDFLLRVPTTLRDATDMVPTCNFAVNNTPVHRFNAAAQLSAFVAGDITLTNCPAPVVMAAVATSSTSVQVTFSRNVLASSVMASGSQFTIDNGLTVTAASVSGRVVTLTTSMHTGLTMYTVTVMNTVTDLQGTALGTPNNAMFAGFVTPAVVRINEVNANITSGTCDLIELRVVSGGSMNGFYLRERDTGMLVVFNGLNVATNDIIVMHHNGGSTTCNPMAATNETTGPAAQPAATHTRNYDTAYDWYSTDAGLTSTDNVITLYNGANVILDAVLIDDGMPGSNVAAASETQAATVATATQWQQVGGGVPAGGFVDDNFRINAAQDSDATGATAAGISIQRIDNTDDNDVADWSASPGAAQSFGLINALQTPF